MTDPIPTTVPLEILDRCLVGEATPDEIAMVHAACQTDATFARMYDEIGQTRDTRQDPRHADRIWPLVMAKRGKLSAPVRPQPRQAHRTVRFIGAIAGAVLVILTSVSIGSWYSGRSAAPATQWTEQAYRTTRGQRATMTLPDGSIVSLAPETKLTFKMSETERRIYVDGHAYFRVALDVLHPFTVESDKLVVRVLGTEFDVYAYGATQSRVAVQSGKVTVAAKPENPPGSSRPTSELTGTAPHILAAGEAVVLNGDRTLTARAATPSEFSWTNGVLVFHDAPAEVVANEIRRYYDLDIRFARELIAHRRVTITLRDQPATELIGIFASALNVPYVRSGRSVTFQ